MMAIDPIQNMAPEARVAARALIDDAGCLPERARNLVDAVSNVAAAEALAVVAGTATVSGGITDTRVTRLKALIDGLATTDAFPNTFEVGVIFRITPTQAGNLIRTYQARHSNEYRARMDAQVTATATATAQDLGKREVWTIQFDDPAALEYAYDKLRRRGLSRSLERDIVELTLTVDRGQQDRHGRDARAALGLPTR
jgi:hypothetical protein